MLTPQGDAYPELTKNADQVSNVESPGENPPLSLSL